jgi:formylglycine-generating enzyme required for sulfatase activity
MRAFLAAWLLALAGHNACAEKRVALVVGNSNYQIAPALTNPQNDARDIAAALKRLNFDVTTGLDLTVAQFDNAVDVFTAAAKDADVALFFFSGHGVQVDKRGYLAPINVKIESESSALRELVAIQEVVSRIENAAKVSVILLDACRDSPLQERLRRVAKEQNKELVPPKGLPPVSVVGSNTLIVYATVPGETASDGSGRNSPFTASLLDHIETPGLAVEIMFARVTADVLKKTGGKQQPERYSRLQTELVLLGPQQTLAPKPPAGPQPPVGEVAHAWGDIKDLKDVAVFEAFRKQYGQANALYDTLASQRIDELKRAQTASNGGTAPSLWPWTSGKPAEAEKPQDTQTRPVLAAKDTQVAVVAPPRPASAPTISDEPVCEGLLVAAGQSKVQPCIKPGSGAFFKDCPDCPEMVVVPSGSFTMGSPESEPERLYGEGPEHKVTISEPFAVGRFAVTFAEWDACAHDGGCGGHEPSDQGWGRSNMPVINVSWNDAQAYVKWLSEKTGRRYRLLSEAEREYAARAGKKSPFWWGAYITPEQANYNGDYTYNGGAKGVFRGKTTPVQSFDPNPWGLYQVHGNVWEWVEDCRHDNYDSAPSDGSAWTTGECRVRSLRGGSWNRRPQDLRAAFRDKGGFPNDRYYGIGFRVAAGWQDLNR